MAYNPKAIMAKAKATAFLSQFTEVVNSVLFAQKAP
jgi:hypothetical protein